MRRQVFKFAVCGVVLAIPAVALADQLILHDGSRLVGKVERIAGGKVRIVTDFSGMLEFDAAKIKAMSVDEAVNISLQSGDRLMGPIQSAPDGAKSMVKSAVGEVAVTSENVTALWREGSESPEAVAAQVEIEKYKPKWTASIEGGIIATEGNSDTLNGNARASVTRKTLEDLLTFYASADYGEQDDVRTKSQYIVGSRYENSFPHRWENWGGPYFWFVRDEFEYDEFENLDLRATVAGGLGHYWIRKERMDFTTRGGAGYRHQSFMDGASTDDPILDLGYDFRYDIREWVRFTHGAIYSPSLEDLADYRFTLDTALVFPIGKTDQWKFKLGVRNEYNSDPRPGFENLDNTYYASVLLEIKK